jgi:hypothetical protein
MIELEIQGKAECWQKQQHQYQGIQLHINHGV